MNQEMNLFSDRQIKAFQISDKLLNLYALFEYKLKTNKIIKIL